MLQPHTESCCLLSLQHAWGASSASACSRAPPSFREPKFEISAEMAHLLFLDFGIRLGRVVEQCDITQATLHYSRGSPRQKTEVDERERGLERERALRRSRVLEGIGGCKGARKEGKQQRVKAEGKMNRESVDLQRAGTIAVSQRRAPT